MPKTVLVVAAHSDDEALGCAGTVAKHVATGDKVHVLFMTDGVGAREDDLIEVNKRLSAAEKVAELLGLSSMQNLDFPDNKMDTVALLDVTQAIEKQVVEIQPDIIYTHHIGDLNIDHQITHKAVMTACRPQPDFCVKEIYTFEVLSSTEWNTPGCHPFFPNTFVDITKYIDIKVQVVNLYVDEMRKIPHSRSIKNIIQLNELRGNSVGVNYAEAFMLMRYMR
ncbi:MAG: LmbE family N-acetylglucosaminyl deacetylase [Oleiphilaceae bacterium]|jgi:LmbE family N-acetylglucosaminyl deacetylase